MQEAGMSIREDAMGNIWAHWEGADAAAGESSGIKALAESCWQAAIIGHATGNQYCKLHMESRSVQNCNDMSVTKHKGHKVLEAP